MAISDILNAGPPPTPKGPRCGVCRLLDSLDEAEAAALRALLADPAWTYPALSAALKGQGHDVPDHRLANHARGQCAAHEKLRER